MERTPKSNTPSAVLNDLKDALEDVQKKASALSDKKRRVELETRKRRKSILVAKPQPKPKSKSQGITKVAPKANKQNQSKASKTKATESPTKDGIVVASDRQPLVLPFGAQVGLPKPQIPQHIIDSLPSGIELGNVSALNTDQHLFYNFHSRLIGGFAPLWGQLVGQTVYRWMQDNSFPKVNRTWVTNVEVIMNPDGEVIDVQHYRMSGFWPFDEAPVKAFQQMKQVPNPPKEMVKEDGYIRLKFQTEVHWRPQPMGGVNIGSGDRNRF